MVVSTCSCGGGCWDPLQRLQQITIFFVRTVSVSQTEGRATNDERMKKFSPKTDKWRLWYVLFMLSDIFFQTSCLCLSLVLVRGNVDILPLSNIEAFFFGGFSCYEDGRSKRISNFTTDFFTWRKDCSNMHIPADGNVLTEMTAECEGHRGVLVGIVSWASHSLYKSNF